MGKPIGQTVLKGMTIDTHLKTAEGRKLLAWVANQPITEDPQKPFLAPWAEKRNEYIREKIGEYQETGKILGPNIGQIMVGKAESSPAAPVRQINTISEAQYQVLIQKLDTILDLLSKKSGGWDE